MILYHDIILQSLKMSKNANSDARFVAIRKASQKECLKHSEKLSSV